LTLDNAENGVTIGKKGSLYYLPTAVYKSNETLSAGTLECDVSNGDKSIFTDGVGGDTFDREEKNIFARDNPS
jgi:hypothetical protein